MHDRDEPAKRPWHEQGTDPDYRFSLANERTFLAWIRTALAILAGGIVVQQVGLDRVPGWVAHALGAALALLAGALALGAWFRWRGNEIAMRHSRSLPQTSLNLVVAITLAVLGLGTIAIFFMP